jgi:hypothetical protein
MNSLQEFYAHPAVRHRLAEYCGGPSDSPDRFSAFYLVGYGAPLQNGGHSPPFRSFPRGEFGAILDRGLDVFRSVWDRSATVGVLDMEYIHFRRPGEVFRNPREAFHKLEPIYQAAQKVFYRLNLTPLVILTGQGYHFSFRVRRDTPAHHKLESLGTVSQSLAAKYATTLGHRQEVVDAPLGRAFDGMGRLLEYAGHMILRELRKQKILSPAVTFMDLAVGGSGEGVALDFSMYGDPLYMRDVRCPFSGYQKHKVMAWKVGEDVARNVPVQVALPRVTSQGRSEVPLEELLDRRASFSRSAELAEACRTEIPDASHAIVNLADSYTRSALYRFHLDFDAVRPELPERWPETYDRFNLDSLPPCVAHCLREPNDNLLKPTNVQTVVRVLMKRGWHPKHIAGLVQSKYDRDHKWRENWRKYDTVTRARFFVRQFAGLLATGLDGETKPFCGHNLAEERL